MSRHRWNRTKCFENLRLLGYFTLMVIIPAEIWLLFNIGLFLER